MTSMHFSRETPRSGSKVNPRGVPPRWMRIALLVGLLAPGCTDPVRAQSGFSTMVLEPSARVRLFAPEAGVRRIVGRLEEIRSDTIVFSTYGQQPLSLARSQIDSVQVSRGRRHLPAAFLGVFAGAAAGAALLGGTGILLDTFGTPSDIPGVAFGLYYGVLIGAPVGAVVLGVRGFEAWATVWPERVSSGPTPAGSMAVGLSIRRP